jgi:hypothetical protein
MKHFDGIIAVGLQKQKLPDQLFGHFLIDSSGEKDCPGLEHFDLQALRNFLSRFFSSLSSSFKLNMYFTSLTVRRCLRAG